MIRILILFITVTFLACGQRDSDKSNNHSLNSDSLIKHVSDNKSDSKDFEKIGFELMRKESLDKLKLGLNVNDLTKILGESIEKSKSELWGADGEYHQTFKYSGLGLELDMIGEKEVDKIINMITVVSPCDYKTNKGISIGSNYKEVEQAYKDYLNPDFSNSTSLVAGSIYGGLIFSFENGKVKSIFLGASAE